MAASGACRLLLAVFAISAVALVRGDDNGGITSPNDYQLPSGFGSWSTVMAHALVNREGSAAGAHSVLDDFKAETRSNLAKLAQSLVSGKPFPAIPALRDEKAFQSNLPFHNPSNITALSLSSVFFNYAPCLISQDAVGAAVTAAGINFVPQVINVAVKGVSVLPIGVEINPAVILVNPQGLAVWPRAINVQPTLIAIAPVDTISNPTGVNVAPYGIAVTGK